MRSGEAVVEHCYHFDGLNGLGVGRICVVFHLGGCGDLCFHLLPLIPVLRVP